MKTHVIVQVTEPRVTSIVCDKCGKEETSLMELQEWFSYKFTGGYNSVFEDMGKYEIDLCQQCFKELLGQYLQYKGNRLTE